MVAKCEWCSLGTLKINETSPKLFNIWVIIYESSKTQLQRGLIHCSKNSIWTKKTLWLDWKWIKIDRIFEKNLKPFFDPLSISLQTNVFWSGVFAPQRPVPKWIKNNFSSKSRHIFHKWIKITNPRIQSRFFLCGLKIWSTHL